MNNTKHMIFVSSSIQHPRHQKRIQMLTDAFEVFVIYSERRQYAENAKSFDHPAHLMLSLGILENKNYHKRLGLFLNLIKHIRARPEKLVFCTSMESAIAAVLCRKQVVLEVGDLHQFESFTPLHKLIDKILIPRLSMLVVTSPKFKDAYYAIEFPKQSDNMVVMENKLPIAMTEQIADYRAAYVDTDMSQRKIRLGLIGAIRFRRMLEVIRELVKSRDDVELHIYGDGEVDVFEGLQRTIFHGPFKNPADLQDIYESIDITVIVYDSTSMNVNLALPNKLYESLAFLKPILCSDNCSLGQLVDENGYGVQSSENDLSANVDILMERYQSIVSNLKNLDQSTYVDDGEELIEQIKQLT